MSTKTATVKYYHPQEGWLDGCLVKVIKAGDVLTEEEMLEFANLVPGDRHYKSVQGPARVKRVIIQKRTTGYIIGPEHLLLRH